jgi:hypothetical protein
MSRVLDPGEHVLLTPMDPEMLLGKQISFGSEGIWSISEATRPGCNVLVRRSNEAWERRIVEDVGRLVAAGSGQSFLVSLRSGQDFRYRSVTTVSNQFVLHGELRGPCGDNAVTRVLVGTGARRIERASGARTAASWDNADMDITWDQPLAWAFSTGGAANEDGVRLDVVVEPVRVVDGDEYRVTVSADESVWLIVGYEESGGRGGFLLPSLKYPQLFIAAHAEVTLPAFRASLRDPHQSAREKLVVYAFRHKEDWHMLRPPQGAVSEDESAERLHQLAERVTQLPSNRWTVERVGYEIVERSVQ